MKYLIWDFDGTLGYREGGMWSRTLFEIVDEAMPELGVTVEPMRPHLSAGYPWETPEQPHTELNTPNAWWAAFHPTLIRAMIGAGVPESRAEELAWQFRPRYTDLTRWRIFPDTLSALEQLSAVGWRHLVLSNHVPELPDILQHLGLLPHLAAVFNSAQTGYEKPHPQAFRNALDFMDSVDEVWMIGDNPKADIAGAAALGIPGILVHNTHPEVQHCCAELRQVVQIVG